MRILGVDPGSRLTGYGCIDLVGNQLIHVAHGTLRLSNTGGRAEIPLEHRLFSIYKGLTEVIRAHRPDIMAVERVFFAKNAVSALKLGQARGAVLLTSQIHGVPIAEYSASEVKSAVVGHGQAGKDQVARVVSLLTGVSDFATSDASDGMALAICHALLGRTSKAGRAQELLRSASSQRRTSKKVSLAEAVGVLPNGTRLGPRGRGK